MKKLFPLLLILSSILVIFPLQSAQAEAVSASYAKIEDGRITIEVKIGAPAPKTILLTQNLPPGTIIIKASPVYNKYDRKTGTATWLLKDIKPGKKLIHFRTEKPITPGSLSAVLRFREPKSGKVVRITVTP